MGTIVVGVVMNRQSPAGRREVSLLYTEYRLDHWSETHTHTHTDTILPCLRVSLLKVGIVLVFE